MDNSFIKPKNPTREACWRAIVLMGRNVASYKLALAKSLVEMGERKDTLIRLEELAEPFSLNLCEHLKHSDKQNTAPTSTFLDACRQFNRQEINQSQLVDTTIRLGFNDVIDAFHVVGGGDTPVKFYEDARKTDNGITLTDQFYELVGGKQFHNLPNEVEARWRLVETAWELDINVNLITVEYDENNEILYVPKKEMDRIDITSSRDALNGYQKGKCFYCFRNISVNAGDENLADVDHFFPHLLKGHEFKNLDGIWNLVLACKECNRGVGGKFERIPKEKYLERLNTRNNYLMSSQNPLKQTLMQQTGDFETVRESFLKKKYRDSMDLLPYPWEPSEELDFEF